ncbi:hypothetical protein HDU76_002695, partial [Blyttiomyces sp. JEL0837]
MTVAREHSGPESRSKNINNSDKRPANSDGPENGSSNATLIIDREGIIEPPIKRTRWEESQLDESLQNNFSQIRLNMDTSPRQTQSLPEHVAKRARPASPQLFMKLHQASDIDQSDVVTVSDAPSPTPTQAREDSDDAVDMESDGEGSDEEEESNVIIVPQERLREPGVLENGIELTGYESDAFMIALQTVPLTRDIEDPFTQIQYKRVFTGLSDCVTELNDDAVSKNIGDVSGESKGLEDNTRDNFCSLAEDEVSLGLFGIGDKVSWNDDLLLGSMGGDINGDWDDNTSFDGDINSLFKKDALL